MKQCEDQLKGLRCENGNDDDGVCYCSLNKCIYKEIDYKSLMEDEHVYKKVHGRIKQVR